MRSLVLFLLFSGFSLAQNWAPSGAQWHYSYYGFLPGYVDITYSGDTLIDGQVTKKLSKTFHGLGWGMDITSYSIGTEYTYEANGVVYLRYQNQWDTLYNFNAQVGESWRMAKQSFTNVAPQNSRIKILETGTLIINNETRKYLVAEKCDSTNISIGWLTDTLIENIGFLHDYLLPYDQFDGAVDGNEGGPFRCYSDNNFATYKPSYLEVCDYIMGTTELEGIASFQIFPNPVTDYINIPVSLIQEYNYFRILSNEGKVIHQGQTTATLDVANLPAGNYTLLIESPTQKRFAKVLVVR
ncbi:MAG: T9SS type A sorting domain-containing protein [Flavobacteriales bacterium]